MKLLFGEAAFDAHKSDDAASAKSDAITSSVPDIVGCRQSLCRRLHLATTFGSSEMCICEVVCSELVLRGKGGTEGQ